MEVNLAAVEKMVLPYFPGCQITRVEDRGIWIRHNLKITLDSGEVVFLKIDVDFAASEKEAFLCRLLEEHRLPAPPVIACDASGTVVPKPYILQQCVRGIKLAECLAQAEPNELREIYRALGKFYRDLHAIHYAHSGWIDGPGIVYGRSPNQHQYEEVIVRIGQEAVAKGFLAPADHQRLQRIWSENLAWLDQHQPTLVLGALPWTVYLENSGGGWQVAKITDLIDGLYWDAAWDLMNIRCPAFEAPLAPELWESFLSEYGAAPDEKRLKIYGLMQQLDAAMGNYMEPASPKNALWKAEVWRNFPKLLDEVERV